MYDVCKCLKCTWIGQREDPDIKFHLWGNCMGELEHVPLSVEEFRTIRSATMNIFQDNKDRRRFYESIIELKENDIVEFGLKLSQFRTQVNQETARMEQSSAVPRCPSCQSTQIRKIDVVERAGSIAFLGIFSGKINKSFKCKNCGYTW
ncbi:MAG: hypothetical protein HFI69_06085 [Lachnospiraceae bacterium]|nr:hypothetical protein [Lachnospiraceae bacterium]